MTEIPPDWPPQWKACKRDDRTDLAGRDTAIEARVRAEVAGVLAWIDEQYEQAQAAARDAADGNAVVRHAEGRRAGLERSMFHASATARMAALGEVRARLAAGSPRDTTPLPESVCGRCRGENRPWSAPSPLWNAVMRGGSILNDGDEPYGGIICAACFIVLAGERIGAELWHLDAQRVPVELETVTPSGRVWDDVAWLWKDTPPPAG